jgi:hypothetical protein
MCPNEKMTGMANLIIKLVCAWLNLKGYLSVVKVESQRLFTFKNLLWDHVLENYGFEFILSSSIKILNEHEGNLDESVCYPSW